MHSEERFTRIEHLIEKQNEGIRGLIVVAVIGVSVCCSKV
jgi:hypothetical protein